MNGFDNARGAGTERAQELEIFSGLMAELEAPEMQPYAPQPSPAFKHELRRRLLAQEEKQNLSWREMGRLWRFASTAVAALVLLAVALYFWAIISNPLGTTSSNQDTVTAPIRPPAATAPLTPTPVPMSAAFTESDVVSWSVDQLNIQFGNTIGLNRHDIEEGAGTLTITLHWQASQVPAADYHVFVHLLDPEGNLVAQQDGPPAHEAPLTSTWLAGETIIDKRELILPADYPDGRYDLLVGWYNPATGERLPVTAANERVIWQNGTAVWLTDWELGQAEAELAPTGQDRIWLISASPEPGANLADPENGPTIFQVEVGYQLVSEPEATIWVELVSLDNSGIMPKTVWQTGSAEFMGPHITAGTGTAMLEIVMTGQRQEGETPVIIPRVQMAAMSGDTFVPFYTKTFSDVRWYLSETAWESANAQQILGNVLGPDNVWLISARQKARPSADSPVEFEVTLGYELAADAEVVISIYYDAPDWKTAEIDGDFALGLMSDWVVLDPSQDNITLTFTGNPADMAQIAGTSQPVLILQMGTYIGEGDNRRFYSRDVGVGTFTNYPFDLNNPAEIIHIPGLDSLEIMEVLPAPDTIISGSTPFTVQVRYSLTSLPSAEIFVSLLPIPSGASRTSEAVHTVTQGSGEVTITFDFTPVDGREPSDWMLVVKLKEPGAGPEAAALASASPHQGLAIDAYHYQP